jgi:hypothetical protein
VLAYLGKVFLKDNLLPTSTYEAKKVVCPLGSNVMRYHACPKDYIIYYKEYAKLKKCSVCDTPRFMGPIRADDDEDEGKSDGAPVNVV